MKNAKESPGKQSDEANEENLDQFIQVLEEHRKQCENEGKYVEAEMAKNRINELKQQQSQREMEQLLYDQAQEREEIERAHIQEYQQFNQQWDQTLNDIEQQDQEAVAALEEKHVRELEENRQNLEQKLPLTFKHSAELLNMKKIQM